MMVQKSGYFSRSAAANQRDLDLIRSMTDLAVDCALRGESGVIGHDEERGDELRAIEFDRIKGGKPFDIAADWFAAMLDDIGQPQAKAAAPTDRRPPCRALTTPLPRDWPSRFGGRTLRQFLGPT